MRKANYKEPYKEGNYKDAARRLKTRNLSAISRETGIAVSTLRGVRDMTIERPHSSTLNQINKFMDDN